MANDWYIREYKEKEYLHKKTLFLKSFQGQSNEHDHCELCWARFSMAPNDLHRGYYEPISMSWICPDCFCDAAELFGWTTASSQS